MKVILKLFSIFLAIVGRIFGFFWSVILLLMVFIDGGKDSDGYDDDNFGSDTINYNYRTGEIDPVKRIDGEYGNK